MPSRSLPTSGVGSESAEHLPVVALVVAFRGFQNLGYRRQTRIPHDLTERFRPETAFTDQLMPVPAGSERGLGIIEMEAPEPVQPQDAIPMLPDPVPVVSQIVAGTIEVAGIGAEPHPVPNFHINQGTNPGQALERGPQRGARPRGGLEQQAHPRDLPEAPADPPGVAFLPRLRVINVVARVRHQIAHTEGLATGQLALESRY